MPETKIAAFVLALIIVCVLFVLYQVQLKRRLKMTLASREPVRAVAFGARHYDDPRKAEIGSFIVSKLEELTGYEFTGVTPVDRIVGDLHLYELDSFAAVEVITEVETRYAITITNTEASRIQTIADFINLVASKAGQNEGNGSQALARGPK